MSDNFVDMIQSAGWLKLKHKFSTKVVYQYSTRMLGFLRLECKMQLSHPRVLDLRKQIYIHYLTFFMDLF